MAIKGRKKKFFHNQNTKLSFRLLQCSIDSFACFFPLSSSPARLLEDKHFPYFYRLNETDIKLSDVERYAEKEKINLPGNDRGDEVRG